MTDIAADEANTNGGVRLYSEVIAPPNQASLLARTNTATFPFPVVLAVFAVLTAADTAPDFHRIPFSFRNAETSIGWHEYTTITMRQNYFLKSEREMSSSSLSRIPDRAMENGVVVKSMMGKEPLNCPDRPVLTITGISFSRANEAILSHVVITGRPLMLALVTRKEG